MRSDTLMIAQGDPLATLRDAAAFIFHASVMAVPTHLPQLPQGLDASAGNVVPEPEAWAEGISSAFSTSPAFSQFVFSCAAASVVVLEADDPVESPAGMRLCEMASSAKAAQVLGQFRIELLKKPLDIRWLGIVMFSMVRTFEKAISEASASGMWNDMSMLIMFNSNALTSGNSGDLRFLMKRMLSIPGLADSLRQHISTRVCITLSTMVSIEPGASFFEAPEPTKLH